MSHNSFCFDQSYNSIQKKNIKTPASKNAYNLGIKHFDFLSMSEQTLLLYNPNNTILIGGFCSAENPQKLDTYYYNSANPSFR